MDEAGISYILEGLGCGKLKTRRGEWVNAQCPFVGNHRRGDQDPSFGVHINPSSTSGWVCQTCTLSGPLATLVRDVEKHTGQSFAKELHEAALKDGGPNNAEMLRKLKGASYWAQPEKLGGIVVDAKKLKKTHPDLTLDPLPEETLDDFKKHSLESMLYLTRSRKLSQRTIQRWELGWDDSGRFIIIPIRNADGELVAYSRRVYQREGEVRRNKKGKKLPKYLHSEGFKRDFFLYGEHFRDPTCRRVILVEGFFHVIWLDQLNYKNPHACMGAFLSDIQKKKLKKWFDEALVIHDGDEAGERMAEDALDSLRPDLQVKVVSCPPGLDAADLSPETLMEYIGLPGNRG